MDLSIIIPCYNEVANIPRLKNNLLPVAMDLSRTRSTEVIFVDDGSRDGTWPAILATFDGCQAAQVKFEFKQHETNQGLGAALRTGFSSASGEVIVTTDSDGTYRFAEIPDLLSCLTDGVDIVTASPYHPRGGVVGVPGYRLVLSRGSSMIYRMLVDRRIHTYTSLFRAYRRQVIDSVPFESDGFLAGTEILVNGLLMGYTAAEYPSVLHVRMAGTSKAKLARTIGAHLRFQAQVLIHRLAARPAAGAHRERENRIQAARH